MPKTIELPETLTLPDYVEGDVDLACRYIELSTGRPFPKETNMNAYDLALYMQTVGGPLVYIGYMGYLLAAKNPAYRPLIVDRYHAVTNAMDIALVEECLKGFDLYLHNNN